MTRLFRMAVLAFLSITPCLAKADSLTDALDANLWSSDPKALSSIIKEHSSPPEQREVIDWVRRKVMTGDAPDRMVPTMMFVAARSGNGPDALMYLDYYRALILVDSSVCPDPTSGGSLIEGSIFLFAPVSRKFPSLTAE